MIKDGLLMNPQLGFAKCQVHLIPMQNSTSRSRKKMTPKYITIHNTGNRQADALAHTKYIDNATGYVSWHFTVDDKMIYQELPINEVAWHAGDGNGAGNMSSIGIEICEHEGINWEKAKVNAVALIVTLMSDLNIPLDNVVPHKHWSGKYCPHRILDEGWDLFVNQIKKAIKPRYVNIIRESVSDPERWERRVKEWIKDDEYTSLFIEKIYDAGYKAGRKS